MNEKEILKEAFDSDLQVLEKAYKSDIELIQAINNIINAQTTIIWITLIEKGIVTMEQWKEYTKTAKDLLNEKEKEEIKGFEELLEDK